MLAAICNDDQRDRELVGEIMRQKMKKRGWILTSFLRVLSFLSVRLILLDMDCTVTPV
mgnify:CR=1 FL=1